VSDSGLTPKQKRFVEEFVIDRNATAAYKRAGYTVKNDNSAAASSCALLRNPKIAAEIEAKIARVSVKAEITVEMVLAGLHREATNFDEGSSSPSARARSWELLGKHLGMFIERQEHTGKGGGPIEHQLSWDAMFAKPEVKNPVESRLQEEAAKLNGTNGKH
jgi:phage terminase small subunit